MTPTIELLDAPAGADACAGASFAPRGADRAMLEHVVITTRVDEGRVLTLTHVARFARADVDPLAWAQLRSILLAARTWTTQSALPAVWPASSLARPTVALDLLPHAWEDARAKARQLGALDGELARELVVVLVAAGDTDDPPADEPRAEVLTRIVEQLTRLVPPATCKVLLRHLDQVLSMHDLRAWCWQTIWAIHNRSTVAEAALGSDLERAALERAIGGITRQLADTIRRDDSDTRQPLPVLDATTRAELVYATNQRRLDLRVTTRMGTAIRTVELMSGSHIEVAVFLESPVTPRRILRAL